jgi:hypothetical protein
MQHDRRTLDKVANPHIIGMRIGRVKNFYEVELSISLAQTTFTFFTTLLHAQ